MLRAEFGLTGALPPTPPEPQTSLVEHLVEGAWAGGVFANPTPLGEVWSVADIRLRVARGQSVVALLNARLLPGHSPALTEPIDDQPVVIVGLTPDGLVYGDPSFSSSLGYGLEISDAAFLDAWQAAATPLQALAISTRPEPPLHDEHTYEPQPTLPTQVVAVASPKPELVATASMPALATPAPMTVNQQTAVDMAAVNEEAAVLPVDESAVQRSTIGHTKKEPDYFWVIFFSAALFLGGAAGFKRLRARLL
jgi:hypothetical protein